MKISKFPKKAQVHKFSAQVYMKWAQVPKYRQTINMNENSRSDQILEFFIGQ